MARRRNLGIYDPPHPSPRNLPEDAMREWTRAYDEAMKLYGDDETATATAWRAVRLGWRERGRKQYDRCANGVCSWPSDMLLPAPKSELVGLGVLVEYAFVDKRGQLQNRFFDGEEPTLYWDDERKAIYVFPQMPYPICNLQQQRSAGAKTYEKWHQRQPKCFSEAQIEVVDLKCVGASDTVSYRSDKWHERMEDPRVRGAQEYIHHNWKDVWTWQDRDNARSRPKAIFIQGGALDLHERGLIH